jgi:hypothetical protein
MKPTKAYLSVFNDIFELKDSGIKVKFTPSRSRYIPELVKRFENDTQRIPSKHWVYVTFKNLNEDKRNLIKDAENLLGELGITFDTDSTKNTHNWSLDWSFEYNKINDGEEQRIRRNIMRKVIKETSN